MLYKMENFITKIIIEINKFICYLCQKINIWNQ